MRLVYKYTQRKLSICCCLYHQNAGQNLDIKIANRFSEIVSQFKYLGIMVMNQNLLLGGKQEETKFR
jgi:hypothetical protein